MRMMARKTSRIVALRICGFVALISASIVVMGVATADDSNESDIQASIGAQELLASERWSAFSSHSSEQLFSDTDTIHLSNRHALPSSISGVPTELILEFADVAARLGDFADRVELEPEFVQRLWFASREYHVPVGHFDNALIEFRHRLQSQGPMDVHYANALDHLAQNPNHVIGIGTQETFQLVLKYFEIIESRATRDSVSYTLFGDYAGPWLISVLQRGRPGINDTPPDVTIIPNDVIRQAQVVMSYFE